ncbi:zinc finger CCCH domain-containing protein 13-like isoform X6 [Maniola jurtina]|uniref:zinc finger CCCH domain-containing protein 13-like isoform X6 n=1 Tax=Maniola jurtina TaxID=191418 RepID=UPI001E689028|nr:zinc finger CCCH domain-containing protein 13-like isoform X6 [Maniola jurtina]
MNKWRLLLLFVLSLLQSTSAERNFVNGRDRSDTRLSIQDPDRIYKSSHGLANEPNELNYEVRDAELTRAPAIRHFKHRELHWRSPSVQNNERLLTDHRRAIEERSRVYAQSDRREYRHRTNEHNEAIRVDVNRNRIVKQNEDKDYPDNSRPSSHRGDSKEKRVTRLYIAEARQLDDIALKKIEHDSRDRRVYNRHIGARLINSIVVRNGRDLDESRFARREIVRKTGEPEFSRSRENSEKYTRNNRLQMLFNKRRVTGVIGSTRNTREERALNDNRDSRNVREERGVNKIRDSRNVRETRALNVIRDSRNVREEKALNEIRDSRDGREGRALNEIRVPRDGREGRALNEILVSRDGREGRALNEIRVSRNAREEREINEAQNSRNIREERALNDIRDSRDARERRALNEILVSRITREARALNNDRDSRNVREERALNEIRVSRNAREGRAINEIRESRNIPEALSDIQEARNAREDRTINKIRDSRIVREERASNGIRDSRDARERRALNEIRDSRNTREARALNKDRDSRNVREERAINEIRHSRNAREDRATNEIQLTRNAREEQAINKIRHSNEIRLNSNARERRVTNEIRLTRNAHEDISEIQRSRNNLEARTINGIRHNRNTQEKRASDEIQHSRNSQERLLNTRRAMVLSRDSQHARTKDSDSIHKITISGVTDVRQDNRNNFRDRNSRSMFREEKHSMVHLPASGIPAVNIELESSLVLKWQYLFYLLQGIYVCSLFMKMPKNYGNLQKTRAADWFSTVDYLKID